MAEIDTGRLRRELRRTWAMFGDGSVDDAVTGFPIARSGAGDLLVHAVAGERHLFVPGRFAGEDLEGVSLRLSGRRLVFDGDDRSFLDVECREPTLFDVFDELVVLVVAATDGSDDPVNDALDVIDDWRDLLRAAPVQRLAHRHELGLFAELWTMRELARGAGFDAVWWRGPLHEPKDIVTPHVWVEVKGVGPAQGTAVINGLEQLADVAGCDGYLAVLAVDEHPAGEQVGVVAAELRGRCDTPDAFDERLRIAGWSDEYPTGRTWLVDGVALIPASSCPRLVPESLRDRPPAGVGPVRYELDLDVARALSVRQPLVELRSLVEEG